MKSIANQRNDENLEKAEIIDFLQLKKSIYRKNVVARTKLEWY